MLGHFVRSFDDKNRILVPSKFRSELGEICYITLGLDKNLEIRNESTFKEWQEKLQNLPKLSKDARAFARISLGNSLDIELDKQGRIGIPNHFIELANLSKEVTFVGVGDKIEMWSKEAFDNFQKQFEASDSLDSLAEKLHNAGVVF